MDAKVIVEASNVWGYFEKNKVALKKSMHMIAENSEFGVTVLLTEEDGFPHIIVTTDDDTIHETTILDKLACPTIVRKIYSDFLSDKVVSIVCGDGEYDCDDETLEEMQRKVDIEEREEVLNMFVSEFLSTIIDGSIDLCVDYEKIVEDCKEHFLEYAARKWGLPVYRPMYLIYEDEDGNETEEYEDFPYDKMEFEDEDNPIYK